jgi:uncharacterized repeat protein (TIGR01451 family)
MSLKRLARLHVIAVLPLALLGWALLSLASLAPPIAAGEPERVLVQNNTGGQAPAPRAQQQVTAQQAGWPLYGPVTPLLEDVGGATTILLSPYSTTINTVENALGSFDIVREGDTYYLWLGSRLRTGTRDNVTSIEQRFESQDGLVWRHRTDTNLAWNSTNQKFIWGLPEVIKNGSLYEGWEEYYYEWTSGWALSIRYITSTDGLNWTVVNQPALAGVWPASVAKVGSTYHMWENPRGDSGYAGTRSLLYRTSTSGGTGWGHWQTDGTLVMVDGIKEVLRPNRVRRLADGTYQLFYFEGFQMNLATSSDGVNFTTQVANLLDFSQILPSVGLNEYVEFTVADVGGEDWFYFTYCTTYGPPDGFCRGSRIAVSRPIRPDLEIAKSVSPGTVSPGDPITYTLLVRNTGSATATGVVITDILPAGLIDPHVASSLALTDTGHSPAFVWSAQDLPPGAGGAITLTARVSPDLKGDLTLANSASLTNTRVETDTADNSSRADAVLDDPDRPRHAYLPMVIAPEPGAGFPVHIGDTIPRRNVAYPGGVFYTTAIQVPGTLPPTGRFYFSSRRDVVAPVLVDDVLALMLDGQEVYAFDFSTSGSPVAAVLEVPRALVQQLAGRTVQVEYRDVYGVYVQASEMWLIWVP